MDIFERLVFQHRSIQALLDEIREIPAHHQRRAELFARFVTQWGEHDRFEMNTLYRAVRPDSILGLSVLTLEAQHERISSLLAEIEATPKDSLKWDAAFAVLRNTMVEHISTEEAIYGDAEKFLGRAAAAAMVRRQPGDDRSDRC